MLAWSVGATLLWVVAGAIDRTTDLEVFADGGRLQVEVAGTELSAPAVLQSIETIEIRAMDSIDPPGGRRLVIREEQRELLREILPRRFRFPPGGITPLGDWELDEGAGRGTVWRRRLVQRGPFTVQATLRGRFLHDLDLVLQGDRTFSVAFRRGLINNDLFIRDGMGITLAASSIDPTPAADAGATLATLLRTTAVAALLIGVFGLIAAFSAPRPARVVTISRPVAAAVVLLLATSAIALSGWVAGGVLEGLPHVPDSVTYLLQAGWLTDGGLWSEASAIQDYLKVPFTYRESGRWLAHYPPGWPLILAAGLALGIPWLVAPFLGGIFIALLYLTGRELDGPLLGIAAATLGLLSPMARLMFGSMLAHGASATLLLASLWLLLVAQRRGHWVAAAASGIALGGVFGMRPLTAAAAAVPLGVFFLHEVRRSSDRGRSIRLIGAALAGGLLAAAPTLAANYLITGGAFTFPYSLAQQSMYRLDNLPFGIRNLDALLASTCSALFGWGWDLVHGLFPLALALAFAAVPFLRRRTRPTDWLLAAMVGVVALAHLGLRANGLHGFGPRYYFEIFACLFLLTARGFQELSRMGAAKAGGSNRIPALAALALFFALNLAAAAVLPHRLSLYQGYNGVDGSLQRQIEAAELRRAVILLPRGDWRGWAMAARLMKPSSEDDLLFAAADPDGSAVAELADGRELYVWRDGRLVQVDAR